MVHGEVGTHFSVLNTTQQHSGRDSSPRRYVVVGPDRHGVVSHALRLGAADPRLSASLLRVRLPMSGVRPRGLVESIPPGSGVMLQVTDRLLGRSPEEAARVVGEVSRRARVALAMHDIPQPAEGAGWYRRRRDAYADMTAAADVVLVGSEHERVCLERCRREAGVVPLLAGRVVVVPLPIDAGFPHPVPRDVQETEVGVLGFLYPGKGVDEVVASAARLRRLGRKVRITCLGAPAEGHAEHASELIADAERAGVPFRITGFVPDDELPSRLRTVGLPVAPHRHISASGSINAWLEAGRRPITLASPYARELADRVPRALNLVDNLETGIIDALAHPERTWLGSDAVLGPSVSEVARRHADILDELTRNTPRMASESTVFA